MTLQLLSIDEYRIQTLHDPHLFLKFKGSLVDYRYVRRLAHRLPCRFLMVHDPYDYSAYSGLASHREKKRAEYLKSIDHFIFCIRVFESSENLASERYYDFRNQLTLLKLSST